MTTKIVFAVLCVLMIAAGILAGGWKTADHPDHGKKIKMYLKMIRKMWKE